MSAISGLSGSSSYTQAMSSGRVSSADAAKMAEEIFAKLDSNSDGSIDATELKTAISEDTTSGSDSLTSQMSTAQFAQMACAGGPPPGGPPPGGPSGPPPASLSSLDEDDDGSISADEFGITSTDETDSSSELAKLFAAIDTDGSGEISSEEATTFEDAMKAARSEQQQAPSPRMSSSLIDSLVQRYTQYAQSVTTADASSASAATSLSVMA